MLTSLRNTILRNTSSNLRSLHKVNKQNDDKQGLKVATDVMEYLRKSKEYKEIIDVIPKSLLRKYKSPETMYLINKKTAEDFAETIKDHLDKEAPVIEVNPGFGFLTRELLKCQKNTIYLFEVSNHFTQILMDIHKENPGRINYKLGDFFGMWKMAFKDKMDGGNRVKELLGDLAVNDKDRILNVVGAMPSLSFVRHLINNIVFHNETHQLGRPDLFIAMPAHHYKFLTDDLIQLNKHKTLPALFQLLFNFKVLNKVPNVHYLPWTWAQTTKKSSVVDEFCLYLVRITLKQKLPCAFKDLPLLWYFFKPQTFSNSTRVIPMLEQWIPGCGVWLIAGQDPPDTNKEVAAGKDDAPLPHMTIFTEFGDLTLHQKITVFKRFISWPEFEQCPYRATMESNLPKYATHIDDEKTNISANIDEIESSDTEIEPENN